LQDADDRIPGLRVNRARMDQWQTRFRLQKQRGKATFTTMTAQDVIEQIKSLPPSERAAVAKFVVEQDDSWIPDDFRAAMRDAEEGRCVGMETALFETPPPRLQ
jgi:hypothetical protein